MPLFLVVLREGIEYGIIVLLVLGVFPHHKRSLLPFAALILVAAFITTGILFPLSDLAERAYRGFMFYGFILLLLVSLVAGRNLIYPLCAVLLSLFFPAAQLGAMLYESLELRGIMAIFSAILGISIAGVLFVAGSRQLVRLHLSRYVGYDSIFIVLAAFCFVFGGVSEFSHSSVITSVQKGLSAFLSSLPLFIRQLLLLPGGSLVASPLDGVLSLIASQRFSMAVTALILFLPPVTVFARILLTPEPRAEGFERNAEKRKLIWAYRDELVKKGIPLLASLAVSIVLLHAANLAVRSDYEPEPVPVVEEGDFVHIPLVDVIGDISDGKMRKYLVSSGGKSYRIIVMMRPDGEVVATLDACEVCPPRGYIQRADHVICKYCNTPIPTQSLGQPGGCNPIPLRYNVEGDILIIKKEDIAQAFLESGKETGSVLR